MKLPRLNLNANAGSQHPTGSYHSQTQHASHHSNSAYSPPTDRSCPTLTTDGRPYADNTGGRSRERIKGTWFQVGSVLTLLYEYFQYTPAGQLTHPDITSDLQQQSWTRFDQYIFHEFRAEPQRFDGLPVLRNGPSLGDRNRGHHRFQGPYYHLDSNALYRGKNARIQHHNRIEYEGVNKTFTFEGYIN